MSRMSGCKCGFVIIHPHLSKKKKKKHEIILKTSLKRKL